MNMKNMKHSFNELKNPKVLLHYALGTIGLVAVFSYLMQLGILTAQSTLVEYLIVFYVVYVIIDRISHGVLNLR